ncbi:ATP phosphoribosyltransferase [Desulfomonile tiedjei]|uniref:ATP phosphoribosyltransferase n=1 Tax=Desulfomonile tiedjei (strain ATCC 49306 / DSM 6799 / DCB-1) TaxID=706587 RepID=I4C477_DESTA|nr:ATP phosphoribosyltransferase [Desulfomonile tiedjei]AFM24368.1 ATP phosphoribosyltransferase (homohexameric) [Desulfomonile tiedjei DSM 6799]
MNKEALKLVIPKGSLEQATIDLFKRAGWNISISPRNYFPTVDDDEIVMARLRAQEISRYVEAGTFDAGLTGKDWILENGSDVQVIDDLVYSKVSQNPARWVLAVDGESDYHTPEDLAGKKIATELLRFTTRFFADRGVPVEVEFSWGSTEAKVKEGVVDAIVDVTETGSTLRANGLRIIHNLLTTNTQFICNPRSYKDPFKREKIEQIHMLLQAALEARKMVGLKMNVSKENLDMIVGLLPSLDAPTVAGLYKSDWFAVESVVSEEVVRSLIPKLLKAGARGIIEYSLNKVL